MAEKTLAEELDEHVAELIKDLDLVKKRLDQQATVLANYKARLDALEDRVLDDYTPGETHEM